MNECRVMSQRGNIPRRAAVDCDICEGAEEMSGES